MNQSSYTPAILLLEDGTSYQGTAVGKAGTATGEICFNTGMTGYQEVFTDPSYFGQLLITTNAHIGNYGINATEVESSKMQIAGLICKNFNTHFSRPSGASSIQTYFEQENLVAIADIDTRALVRHIRDKGAMNAIISSETQDLKELKAKLASTPPMKGQELASKVSTKDPYFIGKPDAPYRVAVLDLGVKHQILQCLMQQECYLQVYPARTPYKEIAAWQPHGYFLSNGPGDPAAMPYAIETTKAILRQDKPLFGICLGHQILALALGIPTYKMHNGHRGINHPVKNLQTGRCEITTQNHGFGVSPEALQAHQDKIEPTHINLNDGTIEGISAKHKKAFSVQYHPEASPGPHDARYLFNQFAQLIAQEKAALKNTTLTANPKST